MKALILAAGYATRLYPLTRKYPKPLLLVDKRPIIDYILDKIKVIKEIDEIIVVTNSKFFPQFQAWKARKRINKAITVVDDLTVDNATRRGAIGDTDFAIEAAEIRDDLLVIGGDNLFDGGLDDLLRYCRAKKGHPVIGVYNIDSKKKARQYGVLKLDAASRVIEFQEKPARPASTYIAMCVYYFPKGHLGLLKEYLGRKAKATDATGYYIDWLKDQVAVYGYIFGGRWFDIGDHAFYHAAKQAFNKES